MAERHTNIDDLIQSFAETLADAVRDQVRDAVVAALADDIGGAERLPKEASSPRQGAGRKVAKTKPRKKGRAAKQVAGGRRVRRSSAELEGQKQALLDLVSAQPDLRAEEIGKVLSMQSKGLAPLLRSLVDEGQLVRTGVARGTRYRRAGNKPAATAARAKAKPDARKRGATRASDKKTANKASSSPSSSRRASNSPAAKPAKQRSKQGKAKSNATKAAPAKAKRSTNGPPSANTQEAGPAEGATYATRAPSEPKTEAPSDQDSSTHGSAPRDLSAEALRWIQNNPGDTSSIIAEALQTSTTRVRAVLQPLLDDGVIERQGDGRGATYAVR